MSKPVIDIPACRDSITRSFKMKQRKIMPLLQGLRASLGFTLLLGMGGCGKSVDMVAVPPRFQPVASIQDLMVGFVDPAADALWDAVSSVTTATGIEEHQPRTPEEWQRVRQHALALIEAGNLLQIEGRLVTHGAQKVEDAHVAGVLNPQQIGQAIDANGAQFAARTQDLRDAGREALSAIDGKDAAALLVAGGKIDKACERCHSVFWYPGAAGPPEKWPLPLTFK